MTRLRRLDCQDGRHCRHLGGYVPTGAMLAVHRFSRALVEAAAVITATIMASRPPITAIGRPRGRRSGGVGIAASVMLSG